VLNAPISRSGANEAGNPALFGRRRLHKRRRKSLRARAEKHPLMCTLIAEDAIPVGINGAAVAIDADTPGGGPSTQGTWLDLRRASESPRTGGRPQNHPQPRSRACGRGQLSDWRTEMDFAALPPEINSTRMYMGAGSGPMWTAAPGKDWGRR
jgi:hypothetical protein